MTNNAVYDPSKINRHDPSVILLFRTVFKER
jgi:hypothetical protein